MVEIPLENLMGGRKKGFPYIMQHFALERLIMVLMVMQERICFRVYNLYVTT
jgi:alkylation response protein AidB-like acyl-CoA dehydrogenase